MIAAWLLREVAAFLRDAVEEYAAAQDAHQSFRKPRVFEWRLPSPNQELPEEEQEQVDFPYIVVALQEGEDTADGSTVRLDLAFGVYRESDPVGGLHYHDGLYDVLALMEHARIALFRQQIIAGKYQLIKPYKWSMDEEQSYPLWTGTAQSLWQVAAALPQLGEEEL